ncbi:MAG: Kazal domain-containing protein [Methylobacteriaceae bacterium]|nr:Kazal domain-containing protein [Methylobacteriaceae bacterium]
MPIRVVMAVVSLAAWFGSVASAPAAKLGERCGGIAGLRCDEGLWCDLAPGMCYAADIAGTCVRLGEMCAAIYLPVCGCDGKTYGNECERRLKKVQLSHQGRC